MAADPDAGLFRAGDDGPGESPGSRVRRDSPEASGPGHAERWSLRVARPPGRRVGLWPVVAAFDAVTRRLSRLIGGDADVEETDTEE